MSDPNQLSNEEIGHCCGAIAFLLLTPLIGAGAGYGAWGFGGLLIGGGIGMAIPISVFVYILTEKESK